MLEEMMAAAKRWHDKTKQPPLENGMPDFPLPPDETKLVAQAVHHMRKAADDAEKRAKLSGADPRWLRLQLWLEENAEKIAGCARGDLIETLDGICDSMYVDAGAAHRFGMDLDGAYEEVVRSNDSKEFSGDCRVRDKGPNYSPPDLSPFVHV